LLLVYNVAKDLSSIDVLKMHMGTHKGDNHMFA